MKCAIILLVLACGALAVPVEDEALQEFINGNRKFTASFYKELIKINKGNFIYSPLSAEVILALTNEGAKGQTAEELVAGLSLPSTNEKTQKAIKSFLPQLKRSEDNLKLLSANKIYVGENVTLEDSFRTIATDIYKSDVENVNFAKNVETSKAINGWVEENTNHKIRNLISPDAIDEYTKLILVNALYFQGKWATRFEDYETKKKEFFKTKDNVVEVDTMHQTKNLGYYESPTLDAKFLELPYHGGDISMVVVLPNEKEGLSSLEQNIEQLLQPQPFTYEVVDVDLPKFTMETRIPLIPILKNLGIRKLFNGADLTGVSSTDKDLFVSDVIQKAFINVTETGTEAAAATASVVLLISAIPKPSKINEFHADHPFLYLIKANGVVLFAGRYADPIL